MFNRKKFIIIVRILLSIMIIANMAVIFAFSAENGEESGKRSDGVIESLAGLIIKNYDNLTADEKENITGILATPVRKAAHMIEYAALSFLCSALVYTFTEKVVLNISIPIIFSFLYAMTDELIHQRMTAGRAGQFTDVCIDTVGAAMGTMFFLFIASLIKKRINLACLKSSNSENRKY